MNLPIRMTAALSPWTVWTIAISVSLLVLIVYSRDSRHLRGLSSFMLPGLRAGAVFLALLTLGKPVWYRETTVGTLGKVIFAIDSSASMSIDDGQELNRLQRALELVYGEADGWCERLSETHEVTSLGFDSIGRKINNDSNLLPDGSITNLAAPLESVSTNVPESLERQATQEDSSSVALVILSDGQHNAVEGYLDRAGELADRSMQVHAIVMGESKTPRDLAILDVDLPTLISDDARVSGDIQIRKVGEWPEGVQVSMMTPDGAPIDSFEVPTGTGVFTLPIDLDGAELVKAMTSPSIAGESAASSEPQVLDLRFEIVAPFDPSEAPEKITSNNIQAHRIAVNRGKKRLLLLEGVPRWEARYLRNFFSRDVAWNVETIHTSESRDAVSSRTGNRLSLQAEEIAGYDVIVVGEVDSKFFDEQDIGAFRQFVSRGGGLILIDGPTDRLRELATFGWKDFFPIEFQGVRGRRQQASSFAITDVGRREGLMGIGNEKIDEWFSNPMRLPRSVRQTKLKADAEVWAEVKTDAQTLPLAVARSLGSGRILYLASDETWRFRFREADKIYGRFWTTIIEAMTPPPFLANTPYASLATDQLEYAAGDLVTVRARLRDPDGSPASGNAVEAIIESEDTTIRRVPMRLVDRERGQYEATIQGLDAANYSLRLSASGFRQDTLDVETPFWVSSSLSSELNEVGADVVTLKEITEATGGITLNESDADSILDRLKPLSAGRRITTDYPIWSSFPWFGAIMMLLTLEWLLRKKASLA